MSTATGDEVSQRTLRRRRHVRRRLILLNAGLGWPVAHVLFMLIALAASPRLQEVMAEAPFVGPLPSSLAAATILSEPFYLWGGLAASLLGGVAGCVLGVLEARLLESAGGIARGPELEKTVAEATEEELRRRLETIEREVLDIASITRKLANLVEPVTTPYLGEEGLKAIDVKSSRCADEEEAPLLPIHSRESVS